MNDASSVDTKSIGVEIVEDEDEEAIIIKDSENESFRERMIDTPKNKEYGVWTDATATDQAFAKTNMTTALIKRLITPTRVITEEQLLIIRKKELPILLLSNKLAITSIENKRTLTTNIIYLTIRKSSHFLMLLLLSTKR